MGTWIGDHFSPRRRTGKSDPVFMGNHIVLLSMDHQDRTGIGANDREVVERVSNQEVRYEIVRCKGANAGESRHENECCRRALRSQGTNRSPAQRSPEKNDSGGVDLFACNENIVRSGKNFPDALLGWLSLRPPVSRIFHEENTHSPMCESSELFRAVIDDFPVAVSKDDGGRRIATVFLYRRKIPGFDLSMRGPDPHFLPFRNPLRPFRRDCDHAIREEKVSLEKEKKATIS